MKKLFALFFGVAVLLFNARAKAAEDLSYIPENPEYALVMIHGYGQSGARMKGMENKLKNMLPNTALYFPTAPDSGPWGGYQWFNIPLSAAQMADKAQYDKMMKEALKNVKHLHHLVDKIHKTHNIPYENISVAGFSQGGLMALLTGLTNPFGLHKAVSFSGVPLLFTKDFDKEDIVSIPQLLVIQGDRDTVIPPLSFQITVDTLKSAEIEPELQIIRGMAHEINASALQRFADFMVFEYK